MVSFNDSIFVMSKWLNLNSMQNKYSAGFDNMNKTNNLSANMEKEKWADLLTRNEPDPDDQTQADVFINNDEWEKLYKEFLKTFRSMDSNRNSIKDIKGAEDYLDLSYGNGRIFNSRKTELQTILKIKNLVTFLKTSEGQRIGSNIGRQIGIDDFNDFLDKIDKKKYDSDNDVKSKLNSLVQNLDWFIDFDNNPNAIKNQNIINNINSIGLQDIIEGLSDKNETIDPQKVQEFKLVYPELLRSLILNKDLRDGFESNGGGKITKPIIKALEKTNYSDENSPDYIAPSEKDTLTPVQELQKQIKKCADDTVLKLKNLALRDKYLFPDTSKTIAVATYDSGFNPKDGLSKFLEKSKDIEAKFKGKNPKSAEVLKFLTDALNYAKTNTPRAFEGALKNGNQGLALDILIANYGLDNGKSDEVISSAHEILSKLRWGYNTSVLREELNKNSFELLSDKGLSWNKHESMQFLSKTFDKTIKFGFMTSFNLANIGVNAVRRRGRFYKLNQPEQNRIDKINSKIDTKITSENKLKSNLDQERAALQNERSHHLSTIANIRNTGFNRFRARGLINTSDNSISNFEQQKEPLIQRIETLEQQKEPLEEQKKSFEERRDLIQDHIDVSNIKFNAAQASGDTVAATTAQNEISQYTNLLNNINTNINNIDINLRTIDNNINRTQNNVDLLDNNILTEQTNTAQLRANAQDFDEAVTSVNELNSDISGLNTSITKIDDNIAKMNDIEKNRFLSLMATRNMMNGQGGYTKNRNLAKLFFASQKKIQENFNNEKGQLSQEYINKYWAGHNVSIIGS